MACAVTPRAEVTVGGAARLTELSWTLLRPRGEVVRGIGYPSLCVGQAPDRPPGHLWQPTGDGAVRDRMHGWPSLWGSVRLRRRLGWWKVPE